MPTKPKSRKDRNAQERKRGFGVIGKAHQYAKICNSEIAVFERSNEGKWRTYISMRHPDSSWPRMEQIQAQDPQALHLLPEDLDDRGKRKRKQPEQDDGEAASTKRHVSRRPTDMSLQESTISEDTLDDQDSLSDNTKKNPTTDGFFYTLPEPPSFQQISNIVYGEEERHRFFAYGDVQADPDILDVVQFMGSLVR
ncbi:uncharacterized protein TRUGW13939_08814 [Talaromyces rugulosus]|uniref:MADS-box domain-containing protein n=1 Tax=Talaromyces rugulosus TaxID=121627 RepID=A0A7H8R5L6_TALRU|nr:uncharacterized protein TRUGW13939_08814 [Talaromyces rugulosus]QKX61662.1 hypothetical protein TRUGW13939_08814 [Talaromyces rugulosus]